MAVAFSAIVEAFAAMESVMLLVDRCQKERSIDVVLDVQSKGPIKAGNQRSLLSRRKPAATRVHDGSAMVHRHRGYLI